MPIADLAKKIADCKQVTYYKDLLENHEDIIQAVADTNQVTVAKQLNMTPIKFSAIYNVLLAYAEEKLNANS